MSEMPLQHRATIGSYQLLQFIGPGPISRVYRGKHQDSPQQKVAVKILEAISLQSTEAQQQILQEITSLAALQHPQILPVLEANLDNNILYLVSQLQTGSLRQRLDNTPRGLLPMKEALAILKQIGEALYFAHQHNRVHANLKPENVLFSVKGEALLADFRLLTLNQSERLSRTLSVFTAAYMAPEQFQGRATPLSDQYALSCLAYQLLTGHTPFEADDFETLASQQTLEPPRSPALLQPERTQHLESVVLKALAKQPEDRYPDVLAFLAALLAPPPLATLVETLVLPQVTVGAPTVPDGTLSEGKLPGALVLPSIESALASEPTWNPVELAEAPTVAGNISLTSTAGRSSGHPIRRSPRPAPASRRGILMVALVTGLAICVSLVSLLFLLGPTISNHQPVAHQPTGLTAQASAGLPDATSQTQPTATATATNTVPTATATKPVLLPGLTPAVTPTPSPGATGTPPPIAENGCQVGYKVSSEWDGGFVANLTITNTSPAALSGWSLVFTFTANQHITSAWNASYTQNGLQVTLTNASYNSTLDPGSSVTSGFQGTWMGSNPPPGTFALNGVTCTR